MAKRDVDGQQELIDVEPENSRAIKRAATAYEKSKAEVHTAGEKKKACGKKLLDLVREAVPTGSRIRIGNMVFNITDRDPLIGVQFADDDPDDIDDDDEE